NDLRAGLLKDVKDRLAEAAGKAVETLTDLLNASSEAIKLKAAESILCLALDRRNVSEVANMTDPDSGISNARFENWLSIVHEGRFLEEKVPDFAAVYIEFQQERDKGQGTSPALAALRFKLLKLVKAALTEHP